MKHDFDSLVQHFWANYGQVEVEALNLAEITEISQSWWSNTYLTNAPDAHLQVIDRQHPLYEGVTALIREWPATDDAYYECTHWTRTTL